MIVVGYGPVGATAANFLGQAGLDVLVIERDPSPFPRARAISTDEDVLRCWQHVGLAEETKTDMLGGRPIDFVDREGRSFMSFEPKSRGNGHPPQMFIYQPALEKTLRAGVDRYPNVEVMLEFEAGAVRQDGDRVALDITDLRDGSTATVRGSYLLACDGGASPIRTQLGIGFEGRTEEDPWLVIDTKVKVEWPEVDHLRFHCDPERPAVDCPTPLGHHRWEFPILPGEDREEIASEENVWRLLSRHGIGPENVEILRRAVYMHHIRFADRWRDDRIFLLGDAAHCMPPWIGQGMASGVRDASNLCWKIAAVLRGEAGSGLLDTYERERQPHVRELTKAAVFFGRVITERRAALARTRDTAFRTLMKVPVAGPYLRELDWQPVPTCDDGLVDPAPPTKLVGRRPRQPFVTDHEGNEARLDDVLVGSWAVLVLPGALERTRPACRYWEALGARTFVLVEHPPAAPGELRELGNDLARDLRNEGVDALVLRPDAYVYTAAKAGEPLAGPPLLLARPTVAEAASGVPEPTGGERALAAAATKLGDRALERAFGNPLALGALFKEMAKAFVPRVANGFAGEIEYDLVRASGKVSHITVTVDGSQATACRGSADDPALTLRVGLADFLRMAAGELDQIELLKEGRVEVTGDGLLGARLGPMFGKPAPADIYVAPRAVDPPLIRTAQEA